MMHVFWKAFINYKHLKKIISITLEVMKILVHAEVAKAKNSAGLPLDFHL